MIYLSDNDIIYKLASCDLLQDTLASLQLDRTDVYVLPTAKYRLAAGKASANLQARNRILRFLASVREITAVGDPEELRWLSAVDGIDPGEAVLFSATKHFEQYLLATGDKVSLCALAQAEVCRPVALRIRGHVICLEQIVLRLIQSVGFPRVKNKILPARDCDTALRVAFGSGNDATEVNVVAALNAYVRELRSLPIDLLV